MAPGRRFAVGGQAVPGDLYLPRLHLLPGDLIAVIGVRHREGQFARLRHVQGKDMLPVGVDPLRRCEGQDRLLRKSPNRKQQKHQKQDFLHASSFIEKISLPHGSGKAVCLPSAHSWGSALMELWMAS